MGLSTNRSRVTHDICVSMELLAHADSSDDYGSIKERIYSGMYDVGQKGTSVFDEKNRGSTYIEKFMHQ